MELVNSSCFNANLESSKQFLSLFESSQVDFYVLFGFKVLDVGNGSIDLNPPDLWYINPAAF